MEVPSAEQRLEAACIPENLPHRQFDYWRHRRGRRSKIQTRNGTMRSLRSFVHGKNIQRRAPARIRVPASGDMETIPIPEADIYSKEKTFRGCWVTVRPPSQKNTARHGLPSDQQNWKLPSVVLGQICSYWVNPPSLRPEAWVQKSHRTSGSASAQSQSAQSLPEKSNARTTDT